MLGWDTTMVKRTPIRRPRPAGLRRLAAQQSDSELRNRLLAVADVLERKPLGEVVQLYGFPRQRLWTLRNRFKAGGIEGLLHKHRRGRRSQISLDDFYALAEFMLSDYDWERDCSNRTLAEAKKLLGQRKKLLEARQRTGKCPVSTASVRLYLNFYLELNYKKLGRGGNALCPNQGNPLTTTSSRRKHVQKQPIYLECREMVARLRDRFRERGGTLVGSEDSER